MKSALKWFLLLPIFIFFFLLIKSPIFAAYYPPVPTSQFNQYLTPSTNPDVPQNMHTYTQSVVIELLSSGYCQLSGYDPISANHKCLGVDSRTGKIGFVENGQGIAGLMGNLIEVTYTPLTSTSQYASYLVQNFGFPKKAYALDCTTNTDSSNGFGFCSLNPLTTMWVYMRNLAYLLFTLIFIVIGVAIMLRVHIDPRTVMTIENQIPKIIIGLLLVTFSLAIAGLLIDLMYVSIYLIGKVLVDINQGLDLAQYSAAASSTNPFNGLNKIYPGGSFTDISLIVGTAITNVINFHFIIPIINVDIVAVLLGFIVLIGLIYALVRVWLQLIFAYITILVEVVFAPFWFLAGLLPGASLGVGAWFRDVVANLAVFPATLAMFSLGLIFSKIGGDPTTKLFNPPLIGGFDAHTLGGLIMLGFIYMTPEALKIMKAALKAPKIDLGPVLAPLGAGAAYPINLGRSVRGLYNRHNEFVYTGEGWRRRSWSGALLGVNRYENRKTTASPTAQGQDGAHGS